MPEQFRVGIPEAERVEGWLYDADSGILMGLASVEMLKKHAPGVVFTMTFAGCPHKVIIHKKPEPVAVEPAAKPEVSIPSVFIGGAAPAAPVTGIRRKTVK